MSWSAIPSIDCAEQPSIALEGPVGSHNRPISTGIAISIRCFSRSVITADLKRISGNLSKFSVSQIRTRDWKGPQERGVGEGEHCRGCANTTWAVLLPGRGAVISGTWADFLAPSAFFAGVACLLALPLAGAPLAARAPPLASRSALGFASCSGWGWAGALSP